MGGNGGLCTQTLLHSHKQVLETAEIWEGERERVNSILEPEYQWQNINQKNQWQNINQKSMVQYCQSKLSDSLNSSRHTQ